MLPKRLSPPKKTDLAQRARTATPNCAFGRQEIVKDSEKNFAEKQALFDANVKMLFVQELAALQDTITIKVLNDDDALELFKKTLPDASSFLQEQTAHDALMAAKKEAQQVALQAMRQGICNEVQIFRVKECNDKAFCNMSFASRGGVVTQKALKAFCALLVSQEGVLRYGLAPPTYLERQIQEAVNRFEKEIP